VGASVKTANLQHNHATDIVRGRANPHRATARGITTRDAVTDVEPVTDILFVGATVTDGEDGTAVVTIGAAGGTPSSGGTATSSPPITMLNNAVQDLLPGDVVVVDDTADTAVTVTTTAASTLIAGVVQAPIAAGFKGPVLFNGYAPQVNTAVDVVRGEYAQTSTTAGAAGSTAARVAGSFAVYLTGNDLADFATDAVVTELNTPDTSLDIDLPAVLPASRFLLLALWLEDAASAPAIPGWTQIGAEEDFWYFYRISTGDLSDAASATWSTASVAAAAVILTNDTVSLGVPIESHDYENTTAAAALSGMSAVPRYAIAGVKADAAPGAGWTVLASGSGSYGSPGTPSLAQSVAFTTAAAGSPNLSLGSALTQGNLLIQVPFKIGTDTWTTDPRLSIPSCGIDTAITYFGEADTNFYGSSGINVCSILGKTVTSDTYAGPFGTNAGCDASGSALTLMEFQNITLGSYEVLKVEDFNTSPANCGTFTNVGANDLIVMAITKKRDGYGGSPDPTFVPGLFNQVVDGYHITNGWAWVGWKVGPDSGSTAAASVSFTSDGFGGMAAIAVLIRGGHLVEGTLAGQYIADDAAVTSPFTGAGNEDDAIFALNLMQPARPSALLYGPDLNSDVGSTATYAWQPLFNSGDGTAILDESGNPVMAFAPV
jgi:hypothetical protein